MSRAFVVALLGAESTGKSTLATDAAAVLAARGLKVAVVNEALREFCVQHERTPRRDEQIGIAREQSRRIEAAAGTAEIVVADTTALMIAVYSEHVFADRSLYSFAEKDQAGLDLTLVTALDLPWHADGLQRDGPQVREPVDKLVCAALARAGIAFGRISGSGPARLASVLAAIDRALGARS